MIFKNAVLSGELTDITVCEGKITSLYKTDGDGYDLHGRRVFAGLIDTHIHGYMGYDVMDGNHLAEISKYLANEGTTSWLATTMTMSMDAIINAVNADLPKDCGAIPLGFHLEGPYISPKYKGAQNEEYIRKPSIDEFRKLKNVKKITIAPEIEGSMEFIRECPCTVSIGHTDADYKITSDAIKNGAKCLTHTFNAMPPLHHRNPGPIGAAMDNDAYIEVIGDGKHVDMTIVKMLYKVFGADRMMFVSDSLACAGLPDGEYESGGLRIHLKDGIARLDDGTIAGSTTTMLKCVKNAVKAGIPADDAFKMASQTPAKSIGIDKGVIEVGADADFIAVDDDLNLIECVIGGKLQ